MVQCRLPIMLAARKLDGEDPKVIFYLRCLYGFVQTVAVLLVLFIYVKASAAAKESTNAVKIYVPSPPQVSVFLRSLLNLFMTITFHPSTSQSLIYSAIWTRS